MKYKTFSIEKNDILKEPMFFGNPINVSRFDKQKYPFFEKQTRKQLGFFWIPEEISLDQDSANFHKSMDSAAQHIFTSNLKYQILLDSVQGRAPNIALLPYTSLPELEAFIETWTMFENLHSRSYTHLIRNIYPDPSSVLDDVVEIQEIVERAKSVTKYYDDFIEYASWYNMLGVGIHTVNGETIIVEMDILYRKLFLMLVAINILEGVRFYVSFACTWGFAEALGLMSKSAKIIKMICRDENLHLAVTSTIIKKFLDGSEGDIIKDIAVSCLPEVYQMYSDAVAQEKDWADYLFKDGSIIGLNAEILKNYVEFIADRRLKGIGLEPIFKSTNNPLPWTEHWIGSKETQVAPQEEEITSYVVGGIKNDISDETFGDLEL
jgi:ribonucleoside-diphosphate reductase beta chain